MLTKSFESATIYNDDLEAKSFGLTLIHNNNLFTEFRINTDIQLWSNSKEFRIGTDLQPSSNNKGFRTSSYINIDTSKSIWRDEKWTSLLNDRNTKCWHFELCSWIIKSLKFLDKIRYVKVHFWEIRNEWSKYEILIHFCSWIIGFRILYIFPSRRQKKRVFWNYKSY